jgi:hypothetical protein
VVLRPATVLGDPVELLGELRRELRALAELDLHLGVEEPPD